MDLQNLTPNWEMLKRTFGDVNERRGDPKNIYDLIACSPGGPERDKHLQAIVNFLFGNGVFKVRGGFFKGGTHITLSIQLQAEETGERLVLHAHAGTSTKPQRPGEEWPRKPYGFYLDGGKLMTHEEYERCFGPTP